MSFDAAIRVTNATKSFPIDARPHRRLLSILFPRLKGRRDAFVALRDLTIEVARGETVGIIGRNGSGKSTLLQLICGTLHPDSGSVEVQGRIAALLELGAGFNPEFTGRENIFLSAALYGMSSEEVEGRLREIVEFAEIGEFIDRPVKTYSSGMYVRLAFSVAISADPDILIVDEALSVGDEAFQRKCFARIDKIRDKGATVLFVSHSASAIADLCDRAILLDHGDLLGEGKPKDVVAWYQRLLYSPADRVPELREIIRHRLRAISEVDEPDRNADEINVIGDRGAVVPETASWDPQLVPADTIEYERRGARIHDVCLTDLHGQPVNVLMPYGEYIYSYKVDIERSLERMRFGMLIRTITGIGLAGAATDPAGDGMSRTAGERVVVSFNFRCLLAPGVYFLNAGALALRDGEEIFVDRKIDVMMFRVLPDPKRLATGLVDIEFGSTAVSA